MTDAVTGVHHITLRVADLARSRRFYEDVLGFEVDQWFPEMPKCRMRLGPSTRLVLVPPLPGTPSGDRFDERRIGLDHVALSVEDNAAIERLAAALRVAGIGADVHRDPLGPALVSFRDPDNIQWEFFEDR